MYVRTKVRLPPSRGSCSPIFSKIVSTYARAVILERQDAAFDRIASAGGDIRLFRASRSGVGFVREAIRAGRLYRQCCGWWFRQDTRGPCPRRALEGGGEKCPLSLAR